MTLKCQTTARLDWLQLTRVLVSSCLKSEMFSVLIMIMIWSFIYIIILPVAFAFPSLPSVPPSSKFKIDLGPESRPEFYLWLTWRMPRALSLVLHRDACKHFTHQETSSEIESASVAVLVPISFQFPLVCLFLYSSTDLRQSSGPATATAHNNLLLQNQTGSMHNAVS